MSPLYGPAAPGNLLQFVAASCYALDNAAPADKLPLFLLLRYDRLNRFYPHPTFSAGEATLDFFEKTLLCLTGETPIPATKEEDRPFRANWLEWCRVHAKEVA